MGYIYKITNLINQKSYIGKTDKDDPYIRWKEHLQDAKKERCLERPLYRAINKYGGDSFSFEILEKVENTIEREKYWIEFYNTYKNGYNATLGGEGTVKIDVLNLIQLYNNGYSCNEISQITGHDNNHIAQLLKQNGIILRNRNMHNKIILQYSKDKILITSFLSAHAAGRWCVENNFAHSSINSAGSHIRDVCNKIRSSAYGFIWEFSN